MASIPPILTLTNFLRSVFNSNIRLVLVTGTTLIVTALIIYDRFILLFSEVSIVAFISYTPMEI